MIHVFLFRDCQDFTKILRVGLLSGQSFQIYGLIKLEALGPSLGLWFFYFCCFCFVLQLRFINVVYQSLTLCFLKGSDLGGFSFSILPKSVLKDLKHKNQPSPTPPSHPDLPKPSPKTTATEKSAENQIHAIHLGFLKV